MYHGGARRWQDHFQTRALDRQTLAFPSYDGNGMFKSLGNVLVNPHVGLLFVDCVNGTATVSETDALLAEFTGAQLVVRVRHADLSELPALHPEAGRRGAVTVCAGARLHAAHSRVEATPGLPGSAAARRPGPECAAGLKALHAVLAPKEDV
jgi:hypothetical protein